MEDAIKLSVNGAEVSVAGPPERSLLSVLSEDLDLTGAKYGCGEGECGACTVLVDGKAVRSCITPISEVASRQITTVEALEADGKLHPLQEAFLETGALQCGYCTCGMILSAFALLRGNPEPSRDEVIRAMNGNICRCGTYLRIIDAVLKAGGGKEARR
jgi:aerobic-type carbon monoxide dehydrogenase small subunit (CoxS/CutS family)